jgi:HSP20 family protein
MLTGRMFDLPAMAWRNPLTEMDRIRREMDLLTSALLREPESRFVPAGVFPMVNITEDTDKYYVRAELPGITPEDIDMQVSGRGLSITGERRIPTEGENVRYHRRERDSGKFARIIELPGEINANKVDAKMVNGVLTVAIAKSEAAKPKQITIKAA